MICQQLGGDRRDARAVDLVETPQIDGEPVGRQFRNLIVGQPTLVRMIHKGPCYHCGLADPAASHTKAAGAPPRVVGLPPLPHRGREDDARGRIEA